MYSAEEVHIPGKNKEPGSEMYFFYVREAHLPDSPAQIFLLFPELYARKACYSLGGQSGTIIRYSGCPGKEYLSGKCLR